MFRARRAFTLIELLVVVAIIALLISILLPTLSRARAQARLVVCQSNLREYGKSCYYYLAEHRDVFPPHRQVEGGPDGAGFPHWYNLLDRYWMREAGTWDPNLGQREGALRVAHCPDRKQNWNYDQVDIGYGYNAYWLGLWAWAWDSPSGRYTWNPNAVARHWVKSPDVKRPSDCITFGDSERAGQGFYDQYSSTLMYPFIASMGEGVWARHMATARSDRYYYPKTHVANNTTAYPNGWGVVAFVDGHAGKVRSKDVNRIIDARRYWDPYQGIGGLDRADETERAPRPPR